MWLQVLDCAVFWGFPLHDISCKLTLKIRGGGGANMTHLDGSNFRIWPENCQKPTLVSLPGFHGDMCQHVSFHGKMSPHWQDDWPAIKRQAHWPPLDHSLPQADHHPRVYLASALINDALIDQRSEISRRTSQEASGAAVAVPMVGRWTVGKINSPCEILFWRF